MIAPGIRRRCRTGHWCGILKIGDGELRSFCLLSDKNHYRYFRIHPDYKPDQKLEKCKNIHPAPKSPQTTVGWLLLWSVPGSIAQPAGLSTHQSGYSLDADCDGSGLYPLTFSHISGRKIKLERGYRRLSGSRGHVRILYLAVRFIYRFLAKYPQSHCR